MPEAIARRKHVVFFVCAILCVCGAVAVALSVRFRVGGAPIHPADATRPTAPAPGRMLIVLVDSLRTDFAFSNAMPFVSGLRERGAWGVSEVVSVPVSIAGDHALFSGALDGPLSILQECRAPAATRDNLFRRAHEQGKRVLILDAFLRGIYGASADASIFEPKTFPFREYRESARFVFGQAHRALTKEKWDIAVVPFYSLDSLGHLETPRSPHYRPMAKAIDDCIRRLVELTTDRDVVFITSEHGMDDEGFHVDASPIVMDAPFVLVGPRVRRGGPRRVAQIDWAPTLSLLAGVRPLYPTPAVPALDLLDMPPARERAILDSLSRRFGDGGMRSLDQIRERRDASLARKGSLFAGVLIGLLVVVSLMFMALAAVSGPFPLRRVLIMGAEMFGLFALILVVCQTGLWDFVHGCCPFLGGFIRGHAPHVLALFAACALVPRLFRRRRGQWTANRREGAVLLAASLIFANVFACRAPYDMLHWTVFLIPLVAWGAGGGIAWLGIFASIGFGIAFRSAAYRSDILGALVFHRWLPGIAVALMAFIVAWRRTRGTSDRGKALLRGASVFAPFIVLIALPLPVEPKAMLFILFMLPVGWITRRDAACRHAWWALWVALFYLGTSGSINHAAHVSAFPMLLAAWAAGRGRPAATRAVIVAVVIWALYLIAGNGFVLKTTELTDGYIMQTAMTEALGSTALVIAARQLLPAAVLVRIIMDVEPPVPVASVISACLLPVVCAVGARLALLVSTPSAGFPYMALGVEAAYMAALLLVFVIVGAGSLLTALRSSLRRRRHGP
ncbi:MAG: hypothetical protein GXP25_04910 [Planctomycetes bacterium]|nr:hypothetical protein [Planctomycetota bacterium]